MPRRRQPSPITLGTRRRSSEDPTETCWLINQYDFDKPFQYMCTANVYLSSKPPRILRRRAGFLSSTALKMSSISVRRTRRWTLTTTFPPTRMTRTEQPASHVLCYSWRTHLCNVFMAVLYS